MSVNLHCPTFWVWKNGGKIGAMYFNGNILGLMIMNRKRICRKFPRENQEKMFYECGSMTRTFLLRFLFWNFRISSWSVTKIEKHCRQNRSLSYILIFLRDVFPGFVFPIYFAVLYFLKPEYFMIFSEGRPSDLWQKTSVLYLVR